MVGTSTFCMRLIDGTRGPVTLQTANSADERVHRGRRNRSKRMYVKKTSGCMHLQSGQKLSEQKKLPENTRRVLRESSTETW